MDVKDFIECGSSYLGIDNNTFATILITFIILIIAKAIDFLYTLVLKFIEYKQLRKNIIKSLELLLDSIQRQSEFFEIYYKRFQDKKENRLFASAG